MEIGFVGLGRMGGNMALRLLERAEHRVLAFDPDASAVERVAQAGGIGVDSLKALVDGLAPPRVVWLMVPAGPPVDKVLADLSAICSRGDLIVDGGNSYYKDSLRRARELEARGLEMMDVGTSGGIWGREIGYCMMVGGSRKAFLRVEPALRVLAPRSGYAHVGPNGAGHFSKMVHNGIEYGLMQAYAEGFAILEGSQFEYDLHSLSKLWNHGSVIRSWLLELAAEAFESDPTLEDVAGYVEDTGEGRWTVQAAIEESVPAEVISAALFARFRSRRPENFADRVLAVLRKEFGGHAVRPAGEQT
ncbi:MAG TPA: decarboxylating 6-phosphogluconate dehydrogenase [Chloroflexota bacterium]